MSDTQWCDWCQHELQEDPEFIVHGQHVTAYCCSPACAKAWRASNNGDIVHTSAQVRADGGTDSSTAAIDRENAVDATIGVDKLDRYLEYVQAVVEEARIQFQTDGVHCYAKGPANVAYVETHLDAQHVEDYEVVDCEVGVEIQKLRTVLDTLEGTVDLSVNVAEQTLSLDDGDAEYETTYLTPDSLRDPYDELDWTKTTKIVVDGYSLKRAVSLASEIGDHVRFDYDADAELLNVTAREDDASSDVGIKPEATPDNGDGWGYYSKSFVTDMMDAIGVQPSVGVNMGDNVPLELGVSDAGIGASYALAPRIKGADD